MARSNFLNKCIHFINEPNHIKIIKKKLKIDDNSNLFLDIKRTIEFLTMRSRESGVGSSHEICGDNLLFEDASDPKCQTIEISR